MGLIQAGCSVSCAVGSEGTARCPVHVQPPISAFQLAGPDGLYTFTGLRCVSRQTRAYGPHSLPGLLISAVHCCLAWC